MTEIRQQPVVPLYEGTFSVGLDKKFNPIERNASPAKGALKLSINPFLIRTGERNILFDAGLGDFGEGTSVEKIKSNLAKYNLSEYDITDIFASHLHYDHLGGLAGRTGGYWDLTFPEARLWVSGNEWEKLMNLNGATDQETAIEFIHFLDAKADLHFLKSEDQPYPEIRVEEAGGHTEFSQILYFSSGNQTWVMAGDIIGRKLAIQKKFIAKFDFDPKKSSRTRERLKKEGYKKGYIFMAYHETDTPLFRIRNYDKNRGYQCESVGTFHETN